MSIKRNFFAGYFCLLVAGLIGCGTPAGTDHKIDRQSPETENTDGDSDSLATNSIRPQIRFATFNASLYREQSGDLMRELATGESAQPRLVAETIQRVRPDVLLLNEFDFDEQGESIRLFQENYLRKSQNQQPSIEYPYVFYAPSNTGIDSGLDLNRDGKLASADDAFGFGRHPGQYGMVVLSKYPILRNEVRTFQKFLWKDMPGALWPIDPETNQSYYSPEIKAVFRLSSKSHWDVPIEIHESVVHFLVSHPTPPVFDGPEDRNGCRNHDEIRFWADYISAAQYIYDDQGKQGGLPEGAMFVIAGDLNADPQDGDSRKAAANQLTEHPLIQSSPIPASSGGAFFAQQQQGANRDHQGDPSQDTADFNNSVGNLRVDYCLPSKNMKLIQAQVFWPLPDEPFSYLNAASDHHLVWIDVAW